MNLQDPKPASEFRSSNDDCRNTEPLLYSSDEVPEALRRAFDEARESYRWGRFVAAVALSRLIGETAVKEVSRLKSKDDPSFRARVDSVSSELLPPTDKERAMRIWRSGSRAVHRAGELFGENDVWQALDDAAAIVARLANAGAFKGK